MSRAAALLVLPLLLPLVPLAEASGEGKARWLGPTGMLEGWHVRVPVRVENPLHREVLDGVATYDLRLGDALLESGWTVSRKGSSVALESFELDPDSIRVVEYRALPGGDPTDGVLVREVPSRARTGLYDATRAFNNRTQPDVHVEWVIPGSLPANGTRTFYVYADTLTNGKKAPASYPEASLAPIDGRGWISRGTTLYGTAHDMTLVGLENDTQVRVDVYSGSKPVPLSQFGDNPNPMTLHQGTVITATVGTQKLIRVVADKPVAALGAVSPLLQGMNILRPTPPFAGPIPSTNGGLVGTEFIIPGGHAAIAVLHISGGDAALARVRIGNDERTVTVSSSNPVAAISFFDGMNTPIDDGPFRLAATAPVMVLEWPGLGIAQMPSVWGAPTGSRLVGIPFTGRFCQADNTCNVAAKPPCTAGKVLFDKQTHLGRAIVTVLDEATSVRGRDLLTSALAFPRESRTKVMEKGVNITPGRAVIAEYVPEGMNIQLGPGCPLMLHTVRQPEETGYHDRGRIQAWAGSTAQHQRLVTPVGSNGTHFYSYWPVAIAAHHNGTLIEVHQDGAPPIVKRVGKGDVVDVPGNDANPIGVLNPLRIEASKPVAVLGRNHAGGWFAGFDDSLRVVPAGTPQYRGYLVSLEPASLSTEPMQGIAAPGKGATFRLLVKNLAKDDQGRSVADDVELRMGALPAGWTTEISETSFRLEGGASKEVILKVSPPEEAEEGDRATFSLTAHSGGNPAMMDRLQVITIIRASYEVGIWYDRVEAPPGKTVTLDPEETKELKVVVKNLASVPDRITVRATPTSPDWKLKFDDAPANLMEVALDPGEVRTLSLRVTAPPTKAAQTNVEVRATSTSDASASDKADATARVRADVRIALLANETLAEGRPGDLVTLRVLFENRGTDRVSIKFNTTGAIPPGWDRPVTRHGGYEIDEISGIVPGTQVPLDVTVRIPSNASRGDRAGLQFFVETMPQFVGDPVLREAIDLVVLAGARHDLTPIDPVSSLSLGFQDQVRAQLSIANAGNGQETLRVVPTRVPEGAGVVVGDAARVPVGGRGVVEMAVAFPPSTPAGTYAIAADLVAEDGHVLPWTFNVTVPERRIATLAPQGPLTGIAGVTERVRFDVANGGNVPLRIPPRLLLPDGWQHRWSDEGMLAPGASQVLTLELLAPREAAPQVYAIEIDPTWASADPIRWDLRTVVLGADALLQQGSVNVRLRNTGTGDAYGVEVILMQGATPVDRAVLQRLPADGNATAILAPRPGETGELRVLVDNETKYTPGVLAIAVSGEAGGRNVPEPGLAPLAILAALAALAVGRRLRRNG